MNERYNNNGIQQAIISLQNGIHNTFQVCQSVMCARNTRAGVFWVFLPPYLQIPNKEGTGND